MDLDRFRPAVGRILLLLAGCLSLAGCGVQDRPADADVARQSLDAALKSWQQGQPPSALASRSPPIVVTDFVWDSQRKLDSYRLIGESKNIGSNAHFDVELTYMGDQRGKSTEKVTYIVGTSPVVTIGRD